MKKFRLFLGHHKILALITVGVIVPSAMVLCVSIFALLSVYPVALIMGWI